MSDVAMLKTEVQSNITHLKTKNTELKTDIAEMEHVIENLNDTLNNLLSIIQLVQKGWFLVLFLHFKFRARN